MIRHFLTTVIMLCFIFVVVLPVMGYGEEVHLHKVTLFNDTNCEVLVKWRTYFVIGEHCELTQVAYLKDLKPGNKIDCAIKQGESIEISKKDKMYSAEVDVTQRKVHKISKITPLTASSWCRVL